MITVCNELPVRKNTYVMHIELDGFGLLLVLKMIVRHKVVDLIDDRRCRSTALGKAWSLKERNKEILIRRDCY